MSNLICKLNGVRGRKISIYDNKCEITTDVTFGSVVTGNATDGHKTIFYIDCAGVQFKQSGLAIGYIQLETPSMQMNNESSNFFSENTFTFENGKNNVTNELMAEVYSYICDRMEGYKYNDQDLLAADLPPLLAKIYGKSRPDSKAELQARREEQRLQEEKESAERKAREEKESAERKARMEKVAKEISKNSTNPQVISFCAAISECTRYMQILDIWKQYGLEGVPAYAEIEKTLKAKANSERMYGPNRNSSVIQKYISDLNDALIFPAHKIE